MDCVVEPAVVYVRTYVSLKRGFRKGLYRIVSQDKDKGLVQLESVSRCPFLRTVTTEALEQMLLNEWADISLTPTRL